LFENLASNAATATLAANLLRSTVKSTPGSVSSKSLMSKRIISSGVANAPKFIRWQSPQAWTAIPAAFVLQVLRHHCGSAAQEGERTHKHPLIALRYQLGHAGTVARRQDCHGVAMSGRARADRRAFREESFAASGRLFVSRGKRAGC